MAKPGSSFENEDCRAHPFLKSNLPPPSVVASCPFESMSTSINFSAPTFQWLSGADFGQGVDQPAPANPFPSSPITRFGSGFASLYQNAWQTESTNTFPGTEPLSHLAIYPAQPMGTFAWDPMVIVYTAPCCVYPTPCFIYPGPCTVCIINTTPYRESLQAADTEDSRISCAPRQASPMDSLVSGPDTSTLSVREPGVTSINDTGDTISVADTGRPSLENCCFMDTTDSSSSKRKRDNEGTLLGGGKEPKRRRNQCAGTGESSQGNFGFIPTRASRRGQRNVAIRVANNEQGTVGQTGKNTRNPNVRVATRKRITS